MNIASLVALLLASTPVVSERPTALGAPERSGSRYIWCPAAQQPTGITVFVVDDWPHVLSGSTFEVRKSGRLLVTNKTGEDGRSFQALSPGKGYRVQAVDALCPSKPVKVVVKAGCVTDVALVLPGAIKMCGRPCKSK